MLIGDGLTDEIAPGDVAVVLGNQVYRDGTPSPRLAARLDRAVELVEQGRIRWVIVSGGTGREGVPEGDAMKRYLVGRGVRAASIIVDNAGVDTWATASNAHSIMQALGLKRAIVVSQYFHIARTRLAFRKHGLAVGGAHARFFELRDLYSTARELPAYVKYALRRTE
ncbi:YdcF family protein [Rhizobium sp. CRIBSB]|nr:YdcF family protein [Rhizobium sp. CRIBSB]